MPEARNQHWLFGPDLLRALVAVGVVPAMTSSVEIRASWDDFVEVRAVLPFSGEQWQAVAAILAPAQEAPAAPSPEDAEKDRMRAIIESTKARDAISADQPAV